MHTLVMTLAGLAVLAAFVLGAGAVNRRDAGRRFDGARVFLWFWAAVSLVNFCIGVFSAGYPVTTELAVHLVIFGVPAAAAWYLSGRGAPAGRRAAP
jgi:hypothetical protein